MFTYLKTASLWGIDADPVAVEVDMRAGLPALNIVGLADITIKEAGERIRAAVLNAGYKFPAKRVTVNLAPAGERKEGSHFDLPIALGIIMSDLGRNAPADIGVIGELSLEGSVRPVKGALALSFGMRKEGIRKIMLPAENAREVSIMRELEIYPVGELSDAICGMVEPALLKKYIPDASYAHFGQNCLLDFSEVVGQEYAKRALAVAVAGNHGMLMVGPPGAGKTMLAKRLPTIMPDLGYEEMLEVTKIYSAAGKLSQEHPFLTERPFVAPHSTVTRAALLGGGMRPLPGDISLAHNGSLITAELAAEQGRTVYAVPGNINSAISFGTNRLIRDGAVPLTVLDDILVDLGVDISKLIKDEKGLSDDEKYVYSIIKSSGEMYIDQICRKTRMSAAYINSIITVLEMKGKICLSLGRVFANRV